MREAVSVAIFFLLLAVAGMEPGHAAIAKTCKTGVVAKVLSVGC